MARADHNLVSCIGESSVGSLLKGAGLILLGQCVASAGAQVVLIDAERMMHARAVWELSPLCFAEDERSIAPEPGNVFDAWGEGLSAYAACPPDFFSAADVKQKSQFLKSLFIIYVDSFGMMKGEFESTPSVDMHSTAWVEFSATRAVRMHIEGTMEWSGQPPAGVGATVHATLSLVGAGGTPVVEFEASPAAAQVINLDEAITLQTGNYTLNTEARQFGVGGFGQQSAMSVLSVSVDFTCYADCDGSGSLDFFDFLCFQNEFAAGTAYADCDSSGSLDFFDFLCFQNAFAAGCP